MKRWWLDKLTLYVGVWLGVLIIGVTWMDRWPMRIGVTLVSFSCGIALSIAPPELNDDRRKYYKLAGAILLLFGAASLLVSLFFRHVFE